MPMPLFKHFCLGSLALVLTACGGGGGGSDTAGGAPVLTGQFMDSAVSGIRYVTETRSGITDNEGQFEYLAGETVSLYIGDQLLGDAPGAAIISLFDLVDGINPLVGDALESAISNLNDNRYNDGKRRPSFSTVINLATLLQTLDKDGNPDNGIEITADVARLFVADSVDFNKHWEDFKLEHGFRKVLAEAKSRALLDSARQTRKPWLAMAHLYASLGIDSKLRATTVETRDDYGRGTPNSVYRYTFDDEGKLTRREQGDGDGNIYSIDIYTYDANGNQTGYEYDYNADGVSDNVTVYTYDIDGNMIRKERHDTDDGRPNLIEIYNYDAYGNEIRSEISNYYRGEFSSTTQSFDANGKQTRGDYYTYGNDTPDSSIIWTYSSNGYEMRRQYYDYGQPRVDILNFDADDNLLHSEYDYDSDGIPDHIHNYTYDAQGNEIRFEDDSDGNGIVDEVHTTTYDADGRMIGETSDYDNDGKLDRTYTSSYDANGNLTSIVDDYDGDGTPNRTYTASYDANGNQTHVEEDYDGDGLPDTVSTTTYEYDTDGNWIRRESDYDGDGTPDSIGTSTYDANGNPTRTEYDYNLDGTPEGIYTWDYAADTDGWWGILHGDLQ